MHKNLFIITCLTLSSASFLHADRTLHFTTTVKDVSPVKTFGRLKKSIMVRIPDDGINGSELINDFLEAATADVSVPRNARVEKLLQGKTPINTDTHYSADDLANGETYELYVSADATAGAAAIAPLPNVVSQSAPEQIKQVSVTVKEQRKPVTISLKIETQAQGARIIQDAVDKADRSIVGKPYDVYYFTADNFKNLIEPSKFYNTAEINRIEIMIKHN